MQRENALYIHFPSEQILHFGIARESDIIVSPTNVVSVILLTVLVTIFPSELELEFGQQLPMLREMQILMC